MGVNIDEAGSDHLAGSIELGGSRQCVADGHDPPIANGDVGRPRPGTAPIHQGPATNDDVTVHLRTHLLGPC